MWGHLPEDESSSDDSHDPHDAPPRLSISAVIESFAHDRKDIHQHKPTKAYGAAREGKEGRRKMTYHCRRALVPSSVTRGWATTNRSRKVILRYRPGLPRLRDNGCSRSSYLLPFPVPLGGFRHRHFRSGLRVHTGDDKRFGAVPAAAPEDRTQLLLLLWR